MHSEYLVSHTDSRLFNCTTHAIWYNWHGKNCPSSMSTSSPKLLFREGPSPLILIALSLLPCYFKISFHSLIKSCTMQWCWIFYTLSTFSYHWKSESYSIKMYGHFNEHFLSKIRWGHIYWLLVFSVNWLFVYLSICLNVRLNCLSFPY